MSGDARRLGTVAAAGLVAAHGSGDLAWQAAMALTLFVTLGLPHGALDHRVATARVGLGAYQFYVGYIATGLAVAATWYALPHLAGPLFLASSAWHFGEADLRRLRMRHVWRKPLNIIRGASIVAMLALAWPDEVAVLLGPWAVAPAALPRTGWLLASLMMLNVGLMLAVIREPARVRLAASLDVIAVLAWLWAAEPLLAFALYFTVWHSADHLRELAAGMQLRPSTLAAAVVPYTVLAAAGGAVLVALGTRFGSAPVTAAALGAIAAVATPHIALVELWLGQRTNATPRS